MNIINTIQNPPVGLSHIKSDEFDNEVNVVLPQTGKPVKKEKKSFFKVKSARQTVLDAQKTPLPKKIIDTIWSEGELCILFGDSNCGKSILAVQVCNAITKGENVELFKCTIKQQPVLYIDFELSEKQFEIRYSETKKDDEGEVISSTNGYDFSDDFLRCSVDNPDKLKAENQKQSEDEMLNEIETVLIDESIKVLIIDNLTYIKGDTEKAKDALPFMKALKALKDKHQLSILVLGHTPKRNPCNPITMNDLTGSKMLMNFFDTAFAIGLSANENNVRYIKQLKVRNSALKYGSDNVVSFEIEKDTNFLKFTHIGYSPERKHLKILSSDDIEKRNDKIIDMVNNQGKSQAEAAKEFRLSKGTVSKIISRYKAENET